MRSDSGSRETRPLYSLEYHIYYNNLIMFKSRKQINLCKFVIAHNINIAIMRYRV